MELRSYESYEIFLSSCQFTNRLAPGSLKGPLSHFCHTWTQPFSVDNKTIRDLSFVIAFGLICISVRTVTVL